MSTEKQLQSQIEELQNGKEVMERHVSTLEKDKDSLTKNGKR